MFFKYYYFFFLISQTKEHVFFAVCVSLVTQLHYRRPVCHLQPCRATEGGLSLKFPSWPQGVIRSCSVLCVCFLFFLLNGLYIATYCHFICHLNSINGYEPDNLSQHLGSNYSFTRMIKDFSITICPLPSFNKYKHKVLFFNCYV